MRLKKLLKYLSFLEEDHRLNVRHIALLSAILCLAYKQGQTRIIKVSRSKIMSLSHISTIQPIINILRSCNKWAISITDHAIIQDIEANWK